ncbi:hypothetical protein OFN54_28665, partial [Escherichia coli]|nr:hypothetical protein [Escherichia coli]
GYPVTADAARALLRAGVHAAPVLCTDVDAGASVADWLGVSPLPRKPSVILLAPGRSLRVLPLANVTAAASQGAAVLPPWPPALPPAAAVVID